MGKLDDVLKNTPIPAAQAAPVRATPDTNLKEWLKQSEPASKPTFNVALDPTTRQIKISAPDWYFKTPEYLEQVKPTFAALKDRSLTDLQAKAIFNSDTVKEIQKQVEQLGERQTAIEKYKDENEGASDDDAMIFFRNIAAAQNSDKDENTQLITGRNPDGSFKYQSVKTALDNLKSYDQKDLGKMIEGSNKIIEDKNATPTDKAITKSLLAFGSEKGVFKADGATKLKLGLESFLAEGKAGIAGWVFNQATKLNFTDPGKGIVDQAKEDLDKDPLKNLEGTNSAIAAGNVGAQVFGIGGDLITTQGRNIPAALAKIPKVTGAVQKIDSILGATEEGLRGGKIISQTVRAIPNDLAFGAVNTIHSPDSYNAPQDFAVNVASNAALLSAAKVGGRLFKAVDTASNGSLSKINNEVSSVGIKGIRALTNTKVIGDVMKKFQFNLLDEAAGVKRTYLFKIADAKGATAKAAAKQDYIEVSNLIRQASQRGVPEANEFNQNSEQFHELVKQSSDFRQAGDAVVAEANEYVTAATNLARIESGQIKASDNEIEQLQTRVGDLAEKNPAYENYRQQAARYNDEISAFGERLGIYDADILEYMRTNEAFAKDYIPLEADLRARTNPYSAKTSSKNLKNTTPVRRLKGYSEERRLDPLLVSKQRLEALTRISAQNGVNARIAQDVIAGSIPGESIATAGQVKQLGDMRFADNLEKEAVDNALTDELSKLGSDLRLLSDDVEDFAGSGQAIISERISASLDNMTDTILDNPQLRTEIDDLAAELGEGSEIAQTAAANTILNRHKSEIVKSIEGQLTKTELGESDRKMVADMFRNQIVERFKDGAALNGKGFQEATRIGKAKREEMQQLRRDVNGRNNTPGPNVLTYFENGQKGTVKVDDPYLGEYFNSRKTPTEDGLVAKFLTATSRVFRFGTTGAEPVFALAVNPLRDVPQAYVTAGSEVLGSLHTPEQMIEMLMDMRGMTREAAQTAISRLKAVQSTSFGNITQTSLSRGDTEQLARKGRFEDENAYLDRLDKEEFKRITAQQRDDGRGWGKYVINAVVPNRAIRNAEDLLGNVEVLTRSKIADARFAAAIKRGASVDDATQEALFFGAEATANFANVGAKSRQILRTMPYLSAALNGSQSFARLALLDPVGVSMRLLGGITMPIAFLTAQNLSDPEKAAAYAVIPDYVKRGNVVIMLDKDTPMLIPLSFELAKVVNPFRDIIEKMHDNDNDSFQTIFTKGLLSASPIDLSGLASTDYKGDVNTGLASAQVLSSFLPQGLKPLLETATGRSSYTQQALNPTDTELIAKGQDGEDGTVTAGDRTYASRDSKVLRGLADLTGIDQGKLQTIVSGYTGTVGNYALNVLDKMAGAPETQQGGRDIADTAARRFTINLDNGGTATTDYYNMIDTLQTEKDQLLTRLDRMATTQYNAEDDGLGQNEERQKLIDAYGQKVADASGRFGEFYNRVGGLKPYQVDSLVDLLNLGPQQGAFDQGTYQNADLQTVRFEAQNDANVRAQELGLPNTADRDLYGRTTIVNDDPVTSYEKSTMANGTFRNRVYGAPKQIAFELSEAVKADKRSGIPALYDVQKKYNEETSKLYAEAKNLKGAAATAKYKEISDSQEKYMREAFDPRIRPLIEKYGPEILRNSAVADEVEKLIVVPGDFTPFASRKKQPYLKDDVWAYVKDRYGVGDLNSQNLMNDKQSEVYIRNINKAMADGKPASANYQLSEMQRKINEGKIFVDAETMDDIAGKIKRLNKR